MAAATLAGWQQLTAGWPWFNGKDRHPIAAYSEFMPPPRLGLAPYGPVDPLLFDAADPWGWRIREVEEAFELTPGLGRLAEPLLTSLEHLAGGRPAHGIPKHHLIDNPFWPEPLARSAGQLAHERCVLLLSLALSRTQDDKGRVRWTLFGVSEQGPARAFWQSCFSAPGVERPEPQASGSLRLLLAGAYGVSEAASADLRRVGLRILPLEQDPGFPEWGAEPLPGWTRPLLLAPDEPLPGVRFLLTFRPFARLPTAVQRAYLDGALHLLPFPGSLVFFGVPQYRRLAAELPFATQIPLLHLIERHEAPSGIRVPQSGWLHEARPGQPGPDAAHGPLRDRFKRTHRFARVLRHQDELELTESADALAHVLFSTREDDVRLYGKPMARNAQIWSSDYRRLLDGPTATPADLEAAVGALNHGGQFGYRFQYPAMRVGHHEVYWQRPLAAFRDPQSGRATLLRDAPLGHLTAYDTRKPDLARPIELWPRPLARPAQLAAVELVESAHTAAAHEASTNARKLLDAADQLEGGVLPASFARALLNTGEHETLESWLEQLPESSGVPEPARRLANELRSRCAAAPDPTPEPLTYARTARRAFEVQYWNTIASLAQGHYRTKNNADCVLDAATRKHLDRERRDLGALGDHLLARYRKLVAAQRKLRGALVGELPFAWRTDFEYPWMGGWLDNQSGKASERNLIVVIPGRDRSQAVIMADHYDTAYMEDCYEAKQGGDGARLAAAGADDNHSATAALLMLARLSFLS